MQDQVDYTDDVNDRSLTDQLDLQHYLRILRKHKWPIFLLTAIVTLLAGYYAYTATPIYRASSTLLIEQQKMSNISLEELYGIENESSDYYQTQFELLKSRNLAQSVMNRLDLWNHPDFSAVAATQARGSANAAAVPVGPDTTEPEVASEGFLATVSGWLEQVGLSSGTDVAPTGEEASATLDLSGEQPALIDGADVDIVGGISTGRPVRLDDELTQDQEIALARLRGGLGISPVRNTKLVNLSFESADPVLAARVANAFGEQYIQSYLDAKLELTTTASNWMNERLGQLKIQLDAAEDRLIAYKRENNLVDVENSVARLNDQQLLLLTSELADARSELANSRNVYSEVQSLQSQPELLESIPAIQADPLVQRVKIEQGTVQRQLDELTNRYGARHPRVVDAQGQLASLNANLEGQIRRLVGTLAKDVQLAQQRVNSLNGEIAAGRSEVQALGDKSFELNALEREAETKRRIYDEFFSTIAEASSADGLETANARISDYARAPLRPVKPKKQLIVALAALASLVLSMLMAFLYETMDDTIKSTNDIEGKLGLKLLGILPLIKTGLLKGRQQLPLDPTTIEDKKGTFAEAVNTARTALVLDDAGTPRKVIVVTSSVPGEGKSTASINLAYSLGQLERVLLIDCDMRRPTIAKAAGLDKSVVGLSSLIADTATARQCIRRGAFGGAIDILPSGPIPDQPLELLSSKRFEKIVQELSRHYDRIVIDSAPTQAVSDALVLSRLSDAVVYIVKSHDTSLELVRRGVQRLVQANAPMAGVLITQVDIDKITSYGGDYYYQGYYDYYGYTDKGERGKRPGKIKLTQEELIKIKGDDREVDLDLDLNEGDAPVGRSRTREASVSDRLRSSSERRVPARARTRFEDDLDIL